MTDTSIALLTGLLAGGFGIIGTAGGVMLGYFLEERREKKKQSEREIQEIYDRLLRLRARLYIVLTFGSFLPEVSGVSQEKHEEEMRATALELSIAVSKAEYIPEAEDVMRLTNEIILHHPNEDLLRGSEAIIASIEGRLKNQDYISARNKVRSESIEEKEKAIRELADEDYQRKRPRWKRVAKKGKSNGA